MLLLGVGLFFSPIVSAIVNSSKTEYDISRLSIRNNVTVSNKPRKSLLNSNARLGNVSRVSRISTTMPWIYQSSYRNSLYIHMTHMECQTWLEISNWWHWFANSSEYCVFQFSRLVPAQQKKHQRETKRMNRKSNDWTDFHWIDQSRVVFVRVKKRQREREWERKRFIEVAIVEKGRPSNVILSSHFKVNTKWFFFHCIHADPIPWYDLQHHLLSVKC